MGRTSKLIDGLHPAWQVSLSCPWNGEWEWNSKACFGYKCMHLPFTPSIYRQRTGGINQTSFLYAKWFSREGGTCQICLVQNNIHLVLMSHAKRLPYGLSIIPTWDKAFMYLKLVLHSMCNSSTAANISAFIQLFSSFCDNWRFLKMNLAAPATSRCLCFCSLVRHIWHEHFRTSTQSFFLFS